MAKDVVVREINIGQIRFTVTLIIISLLIGSCQAQFGFGNFFPPPPAAPPPSPADSIPNFFSPPPAPITFTFSPPPLPTLGSPPAPATGVAAPGGQPGTSFQNPPPQQSNIGNPPISTPVSLSAPPLSSPEIGLGPAPAPLSAPPISTPTSSSAPPAPAPISFNAPPVPTPGSLTAPPIPAPISLSAPPVSAPISLSAPPVPAPVSLSAPPVPAPISLSAPPVPTPASLSAPPIPAPISLSAPPVPAPISPSAPLVSTPINPSAPPVPTPASLSAPPVSAPISPSAPPMPAPISLSAPPVPAPVSRPPVPTPVSAPPVPAPVSRPPAPAPVSPPPAPSRTTTYMIVTPYGYGEYPTVQSAIEAVPVNNSSPVTIELLPGTYTEKLTIPATKPHITLQGAGMLMTIITHNDTANITGSTSSSATISVDAAYFTARNITFQNSAPEASPGEIGAQAVAMRIAGDMAAFYGCGFVSSQDTLLDELGRHYFSDCYIVGNIDVIWGNGQSLYQSCEIQSIATSTGGSLTAQGRTSEDQATGFSFVGGSITGTGNNLLGRAYGMYSRVVFIDTYMEDVIDGAGWSTWPQNTSMSNRRLLADNATTTTVFYGEYGNTGPGANLTKRVSWEKQLTAEEVTSFMDISFIDGSLWLTSV